MLAVLLTLVTYTDVSIEGWTFRVDRAWMQAQPAKWNEVRQEFANQAYRIRRAVPPAALGKLRQVVIWVHPKSPETICAAYHPGAEWLREHKMNPDMAKGIEIGNVDNFLAWTHHQPWMLLHELAHAYHDRFLPNGFDNPDLKAAHAAAVAAKRYERVLKWDGVQDRHYGLNNPMEYFAEASEAYFGRNDFYPFVRPELKEFDPEGFAMVERLWKD
ncbi:MAG: hypothetical protein ACO1SV_01220 [Fimbriimonas sp.]